MILPITGDVKTYHLGGKTCRLIATESHIEKHITFISLHDDENTSVEAYLKSVRSMPGTVLYELSQHGYRLLTCEINKKGYHFDPNRIFSQSGIKKTIANCNPAYPKELPHIVTRFADSILTDLLWKKGSQFIVAIHNNTNNNYSALTYKGSKVADEIFINPAEDPDNFFIVTSKKHYEYFQSRKRNVILQSTKGEDDGSLSVYCQRKNIPYINIEAQHGALNIQTKMIQEAYHLIKSSNDD